MTVVDNLFHYYAQQNIMLQLSHKVTLHINDTWLMNAFGLTQQLITTNERSVYELCTWLSRDPNNSKLCILITEQPLLSLCMETFAGVKEVRSEINYEAYFNPDTLYSSGINLLIPDPRLANNCTAWLRRLKEATNERR